MTFLTKRMFCENVILTNRIQQCLKFLTNEGYSVRPSFVRNVSDIPHKTMVSSRDEIHRAHPGEFELSVKVAFCEECH
jgi:hypothetical protein